MIKVASVVQLLLLAHWGESAESAWSHWGDAALPLIVGESGGGGRGEEEKEEDNADEDTETRG